MQVLFSLIRSLIRSILPHRLTQVEREFIAANLSFWQQYDTSSGKPPFAYVLIEPNAQPILRHCNATFASMVGHARGLRPLFILQGGGASVRALLRSYYADAEFVSLVSWR